jgi:hypothetical protein
MLETDSRINRINQKAAKIIICVFLNQIQSPAELLQIAQGLPSPTRANPNWQNTCPTALKKMMSL